MFFVVCTKFLLRTTFLIIVFCCLVSKKITNSPSPPPTESEDELAPPASYKAGMDRRRKSVFAESYEPGKDDEAVEKAS